MISRTVGELAKASQWLALGVTQQPFSRFYDSNGDGIGDLRGVIEKLEYIQSLGANCIWLLPFFPSPRKDNGYDITDYLEVDPRLGTLEDFQTLVESAHKREIKVIIELVFHHTSNEHPWFLKAIDDPESAFHDYYIWADEPTREPKEANVFPDEEEGVWKFLPQTGKYYHHRFYHFQPDLNIANPNVIEEISKMIDFWLGFDVDGFRIDSAMHMFEEKGSARVEIDGGDYLPQIRNQVESRKKDAALLGEADVPADEIIGFVKNGNRLNLLFNFLLNNYLFLSLVREDKRSLQSILNNQKDLLASMVWVNFARTLDEVDLGQLNEKEREEVYARFAPEKNMRIYGRGIRRHITAMVENEKQLRMAYSLVFATHGIPMIIYGSEIGMGDDLERKGRESVRLPMQWKNTKHAGFSKTKPDEIVGPALEKGEWGYKKINVESQIADEASLWHFFRKLIAVRRENPVIGRGDVQFLETGNPAVLALYYEHLIILHNLSGKVQKFTLSVEEYEVVFGEDRPSDELPPYGFCWLKKGGNVG